MVGSEEGIHKAAEKNLAPYQDIFILIITALANYNRRENI